MEWKAGVLMPRISMTERKVAGAGSDRNGGMTASQQLEMSRQIKALPPRVARMLHDYDDQLWKGRKSEDVIRMDGSSTDTSWVLSGLDPVKQTTGCEWELLEPSAPVREAAQILSRTFSSLYVGGTAVASVTDEFGPGRPIGREVAKMYAAHRLNKPLPGRPKPFRKRAVAHSPRTPIKIGVLQDISFSMDNMARLGAMLAWMVAEATRAVNGQVCMTMFGFDAWPLLAPHEYLTGIPVLTMSGGFHEASWGYELMDSQLSLVESDGARILFVLTDGEYTDYALEDYLAEAAEAGVAIVLVSPKSGSHEIRFPPQTEVVGLRGTPVAYGGYDIENPEVVKEVANMVAGAVRTAVQHSLDRH